MLKSKTLHHHQFLESYTELSERIRTRSVAGEGIQMVSERSL